MDSAGCEMGFESVTSDVAPSGDTSVARAPALLPLLERGRYGPRRMELRSSSSNVVSGASATVPIFSVRTETYP